MKYEMIANLSLPLLSPKNSVSSGKRGGVLEKKPFLAELIKQHVVNHLIRSSSGSLMNAKGRWIRKLKRLTRTWIQGSTVRPPTQSSYLYNRSG